MSGKWYHLQNYVHMDFNMKKVCQLLFLLIIMTQGLFAKEDGLKILVLLDTSSELRVVFLSGQEPSARTIGSPSIFGALGYLAGSVAADTRNKEYTATFQNTIGEFPERRTIIIDEFSKAIAKLNSNVELHFPAEAQTEKYLRNGILNYQSILGDSWRFVLFIKEDFCGLASIKGVPCSLSAATVCSYELHDALTKKKITKNTISSANPTYHLIDVETKMTSVKYVDKDNVLNKRDLFIAEYSMPVGATYATLYYELNKNNFLNHIASLVGQGENFPPIGAILEDYAKRFDYSVRLAKGWEIIKQNKAERSPYIVRMEPKKDRQNIGIIAKIDILAKAFGQNDLTIEKYMELFFDRIEKAGIDLSNCRKFEGFDLDEAWQTYILTGVEKDKSEIMLVKKMSKDFILIYSVIVIGGMEWLEKHKGNIEEIINRSKFEVRN